MAELLQGVGAGEAAARPLRERHTIWELVLHNMAWNDVVGKCARGEPMKDLPVEEGWPKAEDLGEDAWKKTLEKFSSSCMHLVDSISGFSDDDLHETVPGRSYSYYILFHGIIQHNLYHAGQIAILKKKG